MKKEDSEQLTRVGYDPDKHDRSGSFLMENQSIIESLSLYEGLELLPISEAIKKYKWVEKKICTLVSRDDPYVKAVLNTQPLQGAFIYVRQGYKIRLPLQACMYLKLQTAQRVYNMVVMDPHSELHIITGCTIASYLIKGGHLAITEFWLDDGTRLSYTMIHEWAPEVVVIPRAAASIGRNSVFINNYVALTTTRKVQMAPIAYVAENGTAQFSSIIYARDHSHFDIGARAFLNGANSNAQILSRVITEDGTVIVRGEVVGIAPGTRGHTECNGLILGKGSIRAIPMLEAKIDDTELSHEASIGKLKEEEITYLRARGLDEDTARSLIISGFLSARIENLPTYLQNKIDQTIELTLRKGL